MKRLNSMISLVFLLSIVFFSCQKESNVLQEQSITIQPNSIDGLDAILSSKETTSNFGDSEDASLLAMNTDGSLNVTRLLIKFDLSQIPENAVITKAYISLYNNSDQPKSITNTGDNYTTIKRVTSSWTEESVNWESQPFTSETNKVTISKTYIENQSFENIDATNLVKDLLFYNQNYGILVKLQSESATKAVSIASSDHPNSNLHPKLEITYIVK